MIEEKEQIEEVKELPEADEQKRSFKRGILGRNSRGCCHCIGPDAHYYGSSKKSLYGKFY